MRTLRPKTTGYVRVPKRNRRMKNTRASKLPILLLILCLSGLEILLTVQRPFVKGHSWRQNVDYVWGATCWSSNCLTLIVFSHKLICSKNWIFCSLKVSKKFFKSIYMFSQQNGTSWPPGSSPLLVTSQGSTSPDIKNLLFVLFVQPFCFIWMKKNGS